MSETLKNSDFISLAPVSVTVAGIAIIATRCLSVLMLANELGFEEIVNFVHRSAQAWARKHHQLRAALTNLVEERIPPEPSA